VNTFPYWKKTILDHSSSLSELIATHLLATAVKEPHRVRSILYGGAYDGHPMENNWREALVARQKLEDSRSDKFHQGE